MPHTVIADNAGGHLMQHGQVDLVIVGCDRVSARGDVCNKIGTYLKALAAHDNGVPFYVAHADVDAGPVDRRRPGRDPHRGRSAREVTHLAGRNAAGEIIEVQLAPDGSAGGQPGVRRHPGAAGDRADHRTRGRRARPVDLDLTGPAPQ